MNISPTTSRNTRVQSVLPTKEPYDKNTGKLSGKIKLVKNSQQEKTIDRSVIKKNEQINKVNNYLKGKSPDTVYKKLQSDMEANFNKISDVLVCDIKHKLEHNIEAYYSNKKDGYSVGFKNAKAAEKVLRNPKNLVFIPEPGRQDGVKVFSFKENKEFIAGFRANKNGEVVDSYHKLDQGAYPLSPENDPVYAYARDMSKPRK